MRDLIDVPQGFLHAGDDFGWRFHVPVGVVDAAQAQTRACGELRQRGQPAGRGRGVFQRDRPDADLGQRGHDQVVRALR